MTLDDLGNLGEVVGTLGVVATLVYLALQIRQNTRSVRASTFHEAIRDIADAIDQLGHDADLTRVFYTGLADFEALPRLEQQRFASYMTAVLRRYENVLYQAEQGHLDPEVWHGIREHLRYVFSQTGTRAWWKRAHNLFNRQLREFIDRELL